MNGFQASTSSTRRRLAVLFLAVGAALVVATASKDYPREQPIVFRVDDTREAALTATFTKVGEAEPRAGFTLTLPDRRFRDVNHTVRLPNGDYIVTVELERPRSGEAGIAEEETNVSRRVSLSGSEVVVTVPARASE